MIRRILCLTMVLTFALTVATAFEHTNWSGTIKCKWDVKVDGKKNNGKSVELDQGTVATTATDFTLSGGEAFGSFKLPMEMHTKGKEHKPVPSKWKINDPSGADAAAFKAWVEKTLGEKLGGTVSLTSVVNQKTKGNEKKGKYPKSKSEHKLKNKFKKLETKIKLKVKGTVDGKPLDGDFEVEFKGTRPK